jgi:hypothetical protein
MNNEKDAAIVYLDFRETEYGAPLYDGTACPDSLATMMANTDFVLGPDPVEFDTTNARTQSFIEQLT